MEEPIKESLEQSGRVPFAAFSSKRRRQTNFGSTGNEELRLQAPSLQGDTMDFLYSAWVENKLPKEQIEAAMDLALDVFEDRDAAVAWLHEPHVATNNQPPIALLGSEEGFSHLKTLLGRIDHGVLA